MQTYKYFYVKDNMNEFLLVQLYAKLTTLLYLDKPLALFISRKEISTCIETVVFL